MKHNVTNITIEDMVELAQSGQFLHFDNFMHSSHNCETEGVLGMHSHKVTLFNGFRIQEWRSRLNADISIEMKYSLKPVLNLQFMQQGVLQYSTQNKTVWQKGGQNYLWAIPSTFYSSFSYQKHIDYSSFEISIENDYLQGLANKYPDLLSGVLVYPQSDDVLILNDNAQHFTSCEMNTIISQIKNSWQMGNVAGIYTEAKVLELLSLQLRREEEREQQMYTQCCKRKTDIEKIHEARDILLSKLNAPPSILELSREVGINDYKLKCGFKEVFNQTVYGYLFDYKMELARKLLLDTDKAIVEVAYECGYNYASHFTNAFKRKYGIGPKEFRSGNIKK